MKSVDVVINGRGLDLPTNGIPRYMREVLLYLDDLLKTENIHIVLVIPENSKFDYSYTNIDIVKLPDRSLWDFLSAEKYARKNKALYINLASKGVLYKHSICTIHDIRVLREKSNVSWRNIKTKLRIMVSYVLAVRNAENIVTVSQFSKKEIADYYNISEKKIYVIGNGWEHLESIEEDNTIFDEYPNIEKKEYYFSLGSIAPHKNFKWIIENKKKHPQRQYVVMGKVDTNIWEDTTDEMKDIIYVGYQSDERMVALLKNAKALVFPSVYEGFGIPPLEALAYGIPVFVANIPVMHEVFGNTVCYFEPADYGVDLDNLLKMDHVESSNKVLREHSWEQSAKYWLELIKMKVR